MAVCKRQKPQRRKQRVRQKGKGVLTDAVKKFIPSTKHVFKRFWSGDILKKAFTGKRGITSKKFWPHPRKGTIM